MSEINKKITVGVHVFPPIVIKQRDTYTGFEGDLWAKMAQELKVDYEFREYEKFTDVLPAVEKGEVDIAFAGITRTEEREKKVDFSYGTLDSGLHILVPKKEALSIISIIKSVFTKEIKNIFLLLIGFVVVSANVLWLAEGGSTAISGSYFPGIFEALWWAVVTVSTVGYGDITPVTWLGRAVGFLVILSGLAIFGLYVARVSSALTIKELKSDINNLSNLRGKRVATVAATTSVLVLRKAGVRLELVDNIEEAYKKLEKKEIDAVVFDAPVLLYYSNNEGSEKTQIAGDLLESQSYAFALPLKSELRKSINQAILKFQESGDYDLLHKKWFGK